MSFRALDQNGAGVFSFNYNIESWNELKATHKNEYKMDCCNSVAVLKTSKYGVQFFAHKSDSCGHVGESVEHQFCKYVAARSLLSEGWMVETEKYGQTSSGESWIADVYAEKNGIKMAIEIQWSNISREDILDRNEKYIQSGVCAIWLCRNPPCKSSGRLPIFGLRFGDDQGLIVSGFKSSTDFSSQDMELGNFIKNLVSGKFKRLSKTDLIKVSCSYRRRKCKKCNDYIYSDLFLYSFLLFNDKRLSFLSGHSLSELTYNCDDLLKGIKFQSKCANCNSSEYLHNGSSLIKSSDFVQARMISSSSYYDDWLITE